MNIEELGRKAISNLKEYPNFPKAGFIAGGSVANLVWEYVSGNKAKINDIDVFVFDKIIQKKQYESEGYIDNKKLSYVKKEVKYIEDYTGLSSCNEEKEYYLIEDAYTDGIFNVIKYSANSESPQLIINSFDINCTQIGYSIDEDKLYWTKDFENFLKDGILKMTNILSPAHTAIRIVKKKHDLNAHLDTIELKMCQYCISVHMNDTNRLCFTNKYTSTYEKYSQELDEYFSLEKDDAVINYLKSIKGVEKDIFRLKSKASNPNDIFNNEEIGRIWRGQDLLFFVRNILGDAEKTEIWKKLKYLFREEGYIDGVMDPKDINLLSKLISVAPKAIENLRGLKMSEQISIMKILFDKYKNDPIIAISILENLKIIPRDFDDDDILLMELAVRKDILDDKRGKVERIFGALSNTKNDKKTETDDLFGLF